MSELARKRQRASDEPSKAYSRRRQAMITAAAEVFRTKGLSDASLHEISGSIGVDRASLYYYFGSKEQLFRAVILESIEEVVGRAQAISTGTGSCRARLTDLITYVVGAFRDHYPALHIFVQEDMRRIRAGPAAPTGAEQRRLAELADTYMATLENLVIEGTANGEFRDLNGPRQVALVIQGAINWMHRWFDPAEHPGAAEPATLFVSVLLDGLAPQSSTGSRSPQWLGTTTYPRPFDG